MMSLSSRVNSTIDSTTTQSDKSVVALGKRGNRKARKIARRKKKWIRTVRKAIADDKPTRTFNRTNHNRNSVGAATLNTGTNGQIGLQSVRIIPLLTWSNNQSTAAGQLGDDLNSLIELSTNSLAGDEIQTLKPRVYVKSFLMETVLKNYGTNAMYVDVFYWRCKRTKDLNFTDMFTATDAQIADDNLVGSAQYVKAGIDQYGWTPYQTPELMKCINIFKKERYFLQPGGATQIEWRGRVNRRFIKDQQAADSLDAVQNKLQKGLSQGMILIAYGVPQDVVGQYVTGEHAYQFSVNKTIYWQNMSEAGDSNVQNRDREVRKHQAALP